MLSRLKWTNPSGRAHSHQGHWLDQFPVAVIQKQPTEGRCTLAPSSRYRHRRGSLCPRRSEARKPSHDLTPTLPFGTFDFRNYVSISFHKSSSVQLTRLGTPLSSQEKGVKGHHGLQGQRRLCASPQCWVEREEMARARLPGCR